MVEYLRRQRLKHTARGHTGIATIYLKYNDPEQTLNNILADLLKQLVQEQETLPDILRELYQSYSDSNNPPSLDDISAALLSSLDMYSEVFFIIDALDECGDEIRWAMIEKLRELEPKVRLLITSRFQGNIDEELENFKRLEIKANKADIELFIDSQIQKNVNLRRVVEKSPSLRGDIKEGVVRTAKDMYLFCPHHTFTWR